jgi:putative hydrolase of the HAD superfamily
MCVKTILFDLDDTLYPSNCGLWDALSERMSIYMRERLNIPEEEIHPLRKQYYAEFGTTLKGLVRFYGVKPADYLDFVHNVDVTQYIQPDPKLKSMLDEIQLKKVIFTNANLDHAKRVTYALGIQDCFSQMIDVEQLEPHCKPFSGAFEKTMQILGDEQPSHYLFIDDFIKNVRTARELGMNVILLNNFDEIPDDITSIQTIHELPQKINLKTGELYV